MGEQEELFTDEEKVILGEKEPEPVKGPEPLPSEDGEKPPEGEKTELQEKTPEEKQAMESMGFRIEGKYLIDDAGSKIPLQRWDKMYFNFQEEKRLREDDSRKFNLFKELGPEKYYEAYPDEKPEDFKPAEKPKETVGQTPNLGNMIIQGGPHDGKTLNDLWVEDPSYAAFLQNQYLNADQKKKDDEAKSETDRLRESENEVNAFTTQLSKEMFGREPDKLTPQEDRKVTDTIQTTLNWMAKTKRGGGIIADAHFLMNKEGILADARTKGGKEALQSLQKPGVPSVNTGGGSIVAPFTAYEEMSPDQLSESVNKMSEAGYVKFLKEAPTSLRAKHPGLPWS